MSLRLTLLVALTLTGCTAAPRVATPPPQSQPPTTQPHVVVRPGEVVITFQKFDCFCHLAGVEQSLLELPSVTALDWEVTEYRVKLKVKDPPPTDAQLNGALLYSGVTVARIDRP